MGLWNDPVDTIVNRLKDTLVFSDTGNNVSNYALDLLNRAQNWLSMFKQWEFLIKEAELAVGTDRIAQLPTDINTILDIFVDTGGIGVPTIHYYSNSNDPTDLYNLFDTFDATTGHSWYIRFPVNSPIEGTVYLKYTYNLPTIEAGQLHTFFPSELLFRCAQKLHHEDKGTTGDSIEYTIRAFNELLDSFTRNSQHTNQKMDFSIKDRWGNPLKIGGHTLNGTPQRRYFSPYQNSSILM